MLEARGIYFSYGKRAVLKGVDFSANASEMTAILGANGAGKSTLVSCVAKIVEMSAGSVAVGGVDLSTLSRVEVARKIAYVAQRSEVSNMSVFDAVLLGRKPFMKWGASSRDIEICGEMLSKVGMGDMALRDVAQLSGGEAQMVMLARALAQEPDVLLLDEPTSGLDPKNQHAMLRLVREIVRERSICALIVIHDLNLALRWCDKFIFMKDGAVRFFGDSSVVTKETIAEIYGVEASVVEIEGRRSVII